METNTYYVQKIKHELSIKQKANTTYSLRAYARDIGVHHATLSQVMRGKRPLPLKDATGVCEKLRLGPKERTLFMESLMKAKTNLDDIKIDENYERFILDESHYQVIAEWEHYVVLDLFDLPSFEFSIPEIAGRLSIEENRAEVVVNNLVTCGLLIKDQHGQWVKAHENIRTTEDINSQALRDGNREAILMGADKLDEVKVELRDISSMTITMDLEKLPEAKTIIREFRQKMMALLRDGNKTDVYQLAIQLYPLTNNEYTK
jgi:uncharacterized protein (TIGR02147 family)